MNAAISLDWDYVTGDCSNHTSHCGFCENAVGIPKSVIDQRGRLTSLKKDWRNCFENLCNLNYPIGVPFYVAECHAEIFGILRAPIGDDLEIFDFDHHYDNYPEETMFICCGNWITYANKVYKLKVHSRAIEFANETCGNMDDVNLQKLVFEAELRINLVFLCKSSPWTPAKLDNKFYELVNLISEETEGHPIFIGHRAPTLEKEYKTHLKKIGMSPNKEFGDFLK